MNKYIIGGVSVDTFNSKKEFIQKVEQLPKNQTNICVAINSEKIVSYNESEVLRSIIDKSSIRYADGIGVIKAIQYRYGLKSTKIPGCEIWLDVIANSPSKSVFLFGSREEVVTKVAGKLQCSSDVNIVGYNNGYEYDESDLINRILTLEPDIICVAMGSPKQEEFILKCLEKAVPGIFFGLGGSFDVYGGFTKRAPEIFISFGLEWFYRLLKQPHRIFRQRKLFKFFMFFLTRKY